VNNESEVKNESNLIKTANIALSKSKVNTLSFILEMLPGVLNKMILGLH
jgi:hypothetical protein